MAMNIQIFGTNKSFDTKKAQRWFKERGIRFQMIDMKEKGMSRGEFDNVCRAVGGWAKLVDENAKDKDTLALLRCGRSGSKTDSSPLSAGAQGPDRFAHPPLTNPPHCGTL